MAFGKHIGKFYLKHFVSVFKSNYVWLYLAMTTKEFFFELF